MMTKRRKIAPGKSLRDEKGVALLLVLVFMGLGALIIAPLLTFMSTGLKVNQVYQTRTHELYAADAGVREAIWNMKQGQQLPDLLGENPRNLTLQFPDPNGKTRAVTVFCAEKDQIGGTYKITSIAGAGVSNTTIEAWVDTLPFLFDYAAISTNTIELSPGAVIKGPVAGNVTGPGTVISERPIEDPWPEDEWPFGPTFSEFYLTDDVESNNLPATIDVKTMPVIATGFRNGDLTILDSDNTINENTMLSGTIYVKGTSNRTLTIGQTGQNFILDLNKQSIYVQSTDSGPGKRALDVGGKTTIRGSGCIIAEGDINFQPNMNTGPNDYVFVMSVNGEVNFHPTGSFYGTLVGKLNVDLASNNYIKYNAPTCSLNFPGVYEGITSAVHIRTWSVIPPMMATNTPLIIATESPLPDGQGGGAFYSESLTAIGGTPDYTWSMTPSSVAGLTLSLDGVLSGTPTIDDTFTFTVQVTDSADTTEEKVFEITITGLIITTESLPNGYVGVPYSQTLTATGGTEPYTWSITVGSLPDGLSLEDPLTGVISSTPTTEGEFTFTAEVTDSAAIPNTATKELSITIPTPPAVTTDAVTPASVTKNKAELNGTLDSFGSALWPVTLSFEWGLTTSYGNVASPAQSSWSGVVPHPFSKQLTGLSSITTYHYRAKAVGPDGSTVYGADKQFTTLAS